MAVHNITTAADVYLGKVHYAPYNTGNTRGVELDIIKFVSLGTPDTSDTDGIFDGVTVETDETFTYTVGDMVTSVLDVPRNLIVDSTDATASDAVITITGTDLYGATMVEAITMNGQTAVPGKKAFKTLTTVDVGLSANAATLDLGWGNVLGLPFRVADATYVRDTRADNTADEWTVVVADADQDDTSGDPLGTVVTTDTPDNAVAFSCLLYIPDASTKELVFGEDHYTG